MTGLVDSASAIITSSERRVAASASNVANSATPGFKRQISFSEALSIEQNDASRLPETKFLNDFSQGLLLPSGNPLDLALQGPGVLRLRDGGQVVYSRGGSFRLVAGGLLADPDGRVLQNTQGGDLLVSGGELEFLEDGTVLEDSLPIGMLGLFELADAADATALGGSLYEIADDEVLPAETTQLRQRFIEQSNVVMSDEMIAMMAAVRQAEGGARILQFYDQLIGQAIQTFSRSGR